MRPTVLFALVLLIAACQPAPRPYLEKAQEAAVWLDSLQAASPQAMWPDDAERDSVTTTGFSSGVAGITWFYLGLYQATGEKAYLAQAQRGGDYLVAHLPDSLRRLASFASESGLYGGVPGIGFVLDQLYQATDTPRYATAARHLSELLHQFVQPDSIGQAWNLRNDILTGSAGTGLFLLYAAREMDHHPSLALAQAVGESLLARAVTEHGGLTWRLAQDNQFVLPNFSHGGAGIGYFLAELYAATQDTRFLDAALASARYLEAVAKQEDGGFLIPYGWPDIGWDRPYDIGWAHGPAGTARLFYRLWQLTDDAYWLALVEACAVGIQQSGLPGPPNPDFGTEAFYPDKRFGTASVADFLLEVYRTTGNVQYRTLAQALVDDLLEKSSSAATRRWWPTARYNFMGHAGDPAAFTGYFYGAAGYGLTLLNLDAALQNAPWTMQFVDDPFGSNGQ